MKKNNLNTEIILTCKSVWYYSTLDEDMFFTWLKQIKSIIKFDGRLDELYLYFNSNRIPNDDLRELLALFYRYNINMKQLTIFLNDTNKDWFCSKTAYWFKRVFKK